MREYSIPALADIPTAANLAGVVTRRAAEQPQKHGLQRVLGIRRVSRNAVRGAEDHAMMRSIRSIEFVRDRDNRFLCGCALQGTPPVARFHN